MDRPAPLDSALDESRPRPRRRLRGWWLLLVAAALVAGLAVLAVDIGGRITSAADSLRGGLGLDHPALDPHAAQYRSYARQELTAAAEQPAAATYRSNPTYQPDPGQDVAQQFGCLDDLWDSESGWSPTAQNAGSTAYGIAQFLDQTWPLVGVGKTSDPEQQIDAGLAYIVERYGTPCAAWAFWQGHHWY